VTVLQQQFQLQHNRLIDWFALQLSQLKLPGFLVTRILHFAQSLQQQFLLDYFLHFAQSQLKMLLGLKLQPPSQLLHKDFLVVFFRP
jgi:hypothetical protein